MSVTTPRDATWRPALAGVIGVPDASAVRSEPITRHAEIATRWTRLDAAVATSPGGRHAVNEDCHSALDRNRALFVVADGVGGGALAAHASRHLVTSLHGALEGGRVDMQTVRAALLDADRTIDASIASASDVAGAATVALCAATDALLSRWLVAWVGDCRVYRWSARGAGQLDLLTRDDTFFHLGETPPPGGSPHDPARMVGNGATTGANAAVHTLDRGELLVLCSDGVHKHLDGTDWYRVLDAPLSLAQRGQALVALARKRGSVDDATVLLLHRSVPDTRNLRWRGRAAAPLNTEGSER